MNSLVITGGNTGIGKAIALKLAKENNHVIITSRDPEKGRKALLDIQSITQNKNVEMVQADLGSIEGCCKLAEELSIKYPKINVLINNAGVWKTRLELNSDGLESTFMVNYLAPFILSNNLLEVLTRNAPARIINVNAGLYIKGKADINKTPTGKDFNKFGTYANTKLCNVLFTRELACRLEGTGVTVNAVHPGVIKTNLGDSPGMLGIFLKLIKLFWKSPAQGAEAPVWLSTSPELQNVNGKYFMLKKEIDYFENAKDEELQGRLWEFSEKLLEEHSLLRK